MEENKRISDLFERARTEAPKTSFEAVKKHVIAASAAGGVGILAKWSALSFKLKLIIMVTALSALTISTVLIVSSFNSKPQQTDKTSVLTTQPTEQNVEIQRENGVEKTIIFNEKDEVVEITVDSSEASKYSEIPNASDESKFNLPLKDKELIAQPVEGTIVEQEISISEDDSLTAKHFVISEKTTQEELEALKKAALAAGIDINYKVKIRKNIIRRINIDMSIKNASQRKICSSSTIYSARSFSFDTGWMENEAGKAVRFLDGEEIAPLEIRYTK